MRRPIGCIDEDGEKSLLQVATEGLRLSANAPKAWTTVVDGPFVETKEWLAAGVQPLRRANDIGERTDVSASSRAPGTPE